jgi:hypothetical protein
MNLYALMFYNVICFRFPNETLNLFSTAKHGGRSDAQGGT